MTARTDPVASLTGMAKVLLTGSAGSIGSVLTAGPHRLGHEVVGLDLPGRGADLAVDCTDPVAVDAAVARGPARRGHPPRRHPDRVLPARRAQLPRGLDGRPARGDAAPRRTPHRLRLQQPRRRPHAAHRAARSRRPRPPGHLLRRRQGGRRGTAPPLRRPLRHRRRQHPDRLVPRPAHDAAPALDLALPRRPRADVRRRADRPEPGLRGGLRRSPPTPAAGGTSRPAARWATTRRTTPRPAPPRSRPSPRPRPTVPRAPTSAARSPPASSTGPPSTDSIDFERTRRATLVR